MLVGSHSYRNKFLVTVVKTYTEADKFPSIVQFFLIFLFSSKYFVSKLKIWS